MMICWKIIAAAFSPIILYILINTCDNSNDFIEQFRAFRKERLGQHDSEIPIIVVPAGTCGRASGVETLIRIIEKEIADKGLTEKIGLRITGCHGFCEMEPNILIEPEQTFYPKVDAVEIPNIIETSRQFGMQTMDFSIVEMYSKGMIEKDEAIARAHNSAKVEKQINETGVITPAPVAEESEAQAEANPKAKSRSLFGKK